MPLTLSGPCALGDIGRRYTFGLGYTLDGAAATMYGYVKSIGTDWQETSDIQDNEHLSQIASPNSIDRWDRYPRVSQGSWTGGDGQVFFVDPTQYYIQDGNLYPWSPGELLLNGKSSNVALPANFALSGALAVDTDYSAVYLGGQGSGPSTINAVAYNGTTLTGYLAGAAATDQVVGVIAGDNGPFHAVSSHIYAASPTFNNLIAATVSCNGMMAFVASKLWYIHGSGELHSNDLNGTDAIAQTIPGQVLALTGGAGNMLIAYVETSGSVITPHANTILATFDGTTLTTVGKVPGIVCSMRYVNGTYYILAVLAQSKVALAGQFDYTIYSYSGSLSIFDDTRWDLGPFRANQVNNLGYIPGNLSSDGRFLYVAFAGAPFRWYDLYAASPARSAIFGTGAQVANIHWAAISDGNFGTLTVVTTASGSTLSSRIWTGLREPSGTLTTSYFDFSVPTTTKAFLTLEVEMGAPPPAGSSVSVSFRLDDQTGWTAITQTYTASPTAIRFLLPLGTKGSRIQFQITLTASGGGATPTLRSYSVNATLGRIWKVTCDIPLAGQARDLTGQEDANQVSGSMLLANIQDAYRLAGGHCVLFVPSPSASGGAEQVNGHLIDYSLDLTQSGPTESVEAGVDASGRVTLTLIEDV